MEKKDLIEKYKNKKDAANPVNNPVTAAIIEEMDRATGNVIDKLEDLGLLEKTIVIFYSDNGGKELYADQDPLRAGKGWLYEGGVRVPLIVNWPGVTHPGTENHSIVSSVDFFPSFAALLGLNSFENVDGLDIFPILSGKTEFNDRALFWNYPHYHFGSGMIPAASVLKGKYKLIEWYEKSLTGVDGAYELYDLEKDISESKNLMEVYPEIGNEMINMLDNWKKEVNAQVPEINR